MQVDSKVFVDRQSADSLTGEKDANALIPPKALKFEVPETDGECQDAEEGDRDRPAGRRWGSWR
jgi:hypothetical protein